MTMSFSEEYLRGTGDPKDVAYAEVIAGILAARGADIPFPEQESSESVPTEEPVTPGQIALSSGMEPIKAFDDLDEGYTLRVKLADRAKELVQPYVDAVNKEILLAPHPDGFLSRFKDIAHHERQLTLRHGSRNITYFMDTSYDKRSAYKDPEAFNVIMHSGNEYNEKYPRNGRECELNLTLGDQSLKQAQLSWDDCGKTLAFLSDDKGGELLQELVALYPHPKGKNWIWGHGEITLDLNFQNLGFLLTYGNASDLVYGHVKTSFTYIPEKERFEERFIEGYNAPTKLRVLTVEQFLDLTNSMLKIIPTEQAIH